MKLSDLDAAKKLRTKIENCDFHLQSLAAGPLRLRIWVGERGALVEHYGEKFEYLSEEFLTDIHAGMVREVTAKRAAHAAELTALGVEVDEK